MKLPDIHVQICSHPGLPALLIYQQRCQFRPFGKFSIDLPKGYDIVMGRSFLLMMSNRGNEALYVFLIVLVFVYVVLAAQYESFLFLRQLVIILASGESLWVKI